MKIAIFYHCLFSNGAVPINTDHAIGLMSEQMAALRDSGLMGAAEEFYVGVNGDYTDGILASELAGKEARVMSHGAVARTEIPTLNLLRAWLPAHPDWLVMYHHIKGLTHPGEKLYEVWRKCCEQIIWKWRECMKELANGTDACGTHWLTPERFGDTVKSPFFGGTFWFARADFLLTLPPLPAATWANRWEAESWIGRGPRRPVVRDFHPFWPGLNCENGT